ncbi:phosphoribosyl transferase family protein [Sanguibacter keddieii DSM 10542]|uniref:Phosphoribosyl transferase family protein n=1 Tax=Sanguibacter keddieii (strain ATCC 51767 / DSM 10542 / NCFB 3025 / ST-74) TaxID=446469 RepID=D1BEJ9_SANKS|nr:phosphoribosyltransferase family protein [Sanguibacter keddieii]ACZ23285.1 phosphoribosyl transferase family protein [Sanguibacter keddieii DSM 10542]
MTGWTGDWVSARLGVGLTTDRSVVDLPLPALVGLALRRNPRRAHLLVSTVLGKHVPTDPRVVQAAGTLLGLLVADALGGATTVADAARTAQVGDALTAALAGGPGAAEHLLLVVDGLHDAVTEIAEVGSERGAAAPGSAGTTVVVGYAETATALGHCVGAALGVPSLHSTRRPVAGVVPAAGFAEEHSHATEHLLLPHDPRFLADAGTVVLVDDEISTGKTALNTVRALHADRPRDRYVVAALVDLRSADDQERFAALGRELGARVDVVALTSGTISLPDDVLDRAPQVVAEQSAQQVSAGTRDTDVDEAATARATVTRRAAWEAGVREGGRHGFSPDDETVLRRHAATLADELAGDLTGAEVLVLGVEELMYAPLLVGVALTAVVPDGVRVRYSTTTRSPVLSLDDPGYAIRTTVTFPSHDGPEDGPGPRFAHNVAAGVDAGRRSTDIVVVVDGPADTPALSAPGGLLDVLAQHCDHVHLVVVPSGTQQPGTEQARTEQARTEQTGSEPATTQPETSTLHATSTEEPTP